MRDMVLVTHLAIPFLGLTLVDNTDPEQLAVACAEEQRYEFLFTAAPAAAGRQYGRPNASVSHFLSTAG